MANSDFVELSIKDYAARRNKTVQAVYQQMKTKENSLALDGHIIIRRVGNKDVKFLDETAVAILDKSSTAAPVVYMKNDLEAELEAATNRLQIAEKQTIFLEGKLQTLKDLLEEKDAALKLLGDTKAREISSLEAQNAFLSSQNVDLSDVNMKLEETLKKAEKRAEDAFVAFDDAKKEFEDKEAMMQNAIDRQNQRIAELENRTLFDYIKGLFGKKGNKHGQDNV